jgi:hypothetical protein
VECRPSDPKGHSERLRRRLSRGGLQGCQWKRLIRVSDTYRVVTTCQEVRSWATHS